MASTPLKKNTRMWLTAAVIVGVLALVGVGRPPTEQVLTFLGLTLAAYNAQSQAGQRFGEKVAAEASRARPPA